MLYDKKNNTHPLRRLTGFFDNKILLIIILIIIITGFMIYLVRGFNFTIKTNNKFGITPIQISKIKSIGQWEFLAISDEELVDTVRHGFFGDDELSRIYYGTLRLGIDLSQTKEGWIKMDEDTVNVMLPPIKLLDENFLDEARTKYFFEDGKWSDMDKQKLTQKAARVMKERCLTQANIQSAEQNASVQFDNMLHAMGFNFTKIRFDKKKAKK